MRQLKLRRFFCVVYFFFFLFHFGLKVFFQCNVRRISLAYEKKHFFCNCTLPFFWMGKESKFRFLKPKKGCAFWRVKSNPYDHWDSPPERFWERTWRKNVFDKWFSVQKFYTIFDLFTEPYQWRRHYADLAKKTRGVNRFLSLCRATSLEVKLYFWGILTTQAHQAVNSSLIIPSLCLLWKRNNRMCKSC